jgi:CDP-2,3-bis-(O-geranylgeranyl)-sn-glycerol synthase
MNLMTFLLAVYTYLPAYVANASPVVLGGGTPLDGGRLWRDEKPLLGDHKTVKGAALGFLVGLVVGVAQGNPVGGALQSIGAIGGDLVGSFYKRRVDIKPGDSLLLSDQLDFIVLAVALSYPVQRTPWDQVAAILLITLPLHYLVNVVAWALKLKKNPW